MVYVLKTVEIIIIMTKIAENVFIVTMVHVKNVLMEKYVKNVMMVMSIKMVYVKKFVMKNM